MKIILFVLFLFILFLNKVLAQNGDIQLLHKINSGQSEFLHDYSIVISNTTTYVSLSIPVAEAVLGWVERDEERLHNAFYMGATFGVSALMSLSLKELIKRPRPEVTYPNRIEPYKYLQEHSFPSGHTYEAFSSATALSLTHPKWYVIAPAYLWAGSVAYSRMNLGVHYPSDVLAGAVLGAGSAYLTYKINEWFWKKQDNKKLLVIQNYL